jgi:glycosyltransferase involved in cell wall biosynthesis
MLPQAHHVEIGIGYPDCFFPLRIYETYQWWAWHQGKEGKPGNAYQWVCPMGYNLDEWEPNYDYGKYLLYFGRVIECKGLQVVKEIAKRVDMPVIMCGSGDPELFLDPEIPNLIYKEPVTGLARSELLRNAYAMLMPTVYTEPFGGAGVEGQLCGTPLLASDFGAFSETVEHNHTGFRCKTLGDWLDAVANVKELDREYIANSTRMKYSLAAVGDQMDRIFRQIETLSTDGWYNESGFDAIWS